VPQPFTVTAKEGPPVGSEQLQEHETRLRVLGSEALQPVAGQAATHAGVDPHTGLTSQVPVESPDEQ